MTSRLMTGLLTAVLGLALGLGGIQDAEAKRLGGGKSFGSRPAYSLPYQQRTTPPATPSATRGAEPGAAAAQNAVQRQSLANRGGLMGMLGGLALGGLLGAMIFGGAFEGLNLFDVVLLVAVAGLLYYLFVVRRRRGPVPTPAAAGYGALAGAGSDGAAGSPGGTVLRREATTTQEADTGPAGAGGGAPSGTSAALPPGFDSERFLEGARRAYRSLQDAWDRGDLGQMRALTSDDVFAELQEQLRARQGDNRTEVLRLDATLIEARDGGPELEASVLFEARLREVDAEHGADEHEVREVWHFVKPAGSREPTWLLDGIQQAG